MNMDRYSAAMDGTIDEQWDVLRGILSEGHEVFRLQQENARLRDEIKRLRMEQDGGGQ